MTYDRSPFHKRRKASNHYKRYNPMLPSSEPPSSKYTHANIPLMLMRLIILPHAPFPSFPPPLVLYTEKVEKLPSVRRAMSNMHTKVPLSSRAKSSKRQLDLLFPAEIFILLIGPGVVLDPQIRRHVHGRTTGHHRQCRVRR